MCNISQIEQSKLGRGGPCTALQAKGPEEPSLLQQAMFEYDDANTLEICLYRPGEDHGRKTLFVQMLKTNDHAEY